MKILKLFERTASDSGASTNTEKGGRLTPFDMPKHHQNQNSTAAVPVAIAISLPMRYGGGQTADLTILLDTQLTALNGEKDSNRLRCQSRFHHSEIGHNSTSLNVDVHDTHIILTSPPSPLARGFIDAEKPKAKQRYSAHFKGIDAECLTLILGSGIDLDFPKSSGSPLATHSHDVPTQSSNSQETTNGDFDWHR